MKFKGFYYNISCYRAKWARKYCTWIVAKYKTNCPISRLIFRYFEQRILKNHFRNTAVIWYTYVQEIWPQKDYDYSTCASALIRGFVCKYRGHFKICIFLVFYPHIQRCQRHVEILRLFVPWYRKELCFKCCKAWRNSELNSWANRFFCCHLKSLSF